MAAYVTETEVKSLWKTSINSMIRECRTNEKLPEALMEIIKHNLYAKFASYDAATAQIEIGVNESKTRASTYPTIKIYNFPLDQLEERLVSSRQLQRADLEFYAKILQGKSLEDRMLVL